MTTITTFTDYLEEQIILEEKEKVFNLLKNLLKALKEAIEILNSTEFIDGEKIYNNKREEFNKLLSEIKKIRDEKIHKLINNEKFDKLEKFFENSEENFRMIVNRVVNKPNSYLYIIIDKETRIIFGLSLVDAYNMYNLALQLTTQFEELRLYKQSEEPAPIVPSVTCAANWEPNNSIRVKGQYPKINLNDLVSKTKTHLIALIATIHKVEKKKKSTTSTLSLLKKILDDDNLEELIDKSEITSSELDILMKYLPKEVDTIVQEVESFKRYVEMRKKEVNNIDDALKKTAEDYFKQSMFAKKYMKSE